MTDFYRVNNGLDNTNKIKLINTMILKLAGLTDDANFNKNEVDALYTLLGVSAKYLRNQGIGNSLSTYSGWTHYKAEGSYSIWKFAPTNYSYSSYNQLFSNDISFENKGQATAETSQFTKIFTYDDESGVGYTDVLTDISSEGTDEVAVLEDTGDYIYIGSSSTFTGIALEFKTRGSNYTLDIEYYDDQSGYGWTALGEADNLTDNTGDFKSDGSITWDAPENWAETTVNSQNLYWIRISTSTTPVTQAEIYYLTSGNSVEGLLSLSSTEVIEQTWKFCSYNSYVYVTIPNAGATAYEGDEFITSSSSSTNLQNYFIYNKPFTANYLDSTYSSDFVTDAANVSFSHSGFSADNVEDAIVEASGGSGNANSYSGTFDNGDLVGGILTITHSLNDSSPILNIRNNNGKTIDPDDDDASDANTILVDLTSWGVISGTWSYKVTV